MAIYIHIYIWSVYDSDNASQHPKLVFTIQPGTSFRPASPVWPPSPTSVRGDFCVDWKIVIVRYWDDWKLSMIKTFRYWDDWKYWNILKYQVPILKMMVLWYHWNHWKDGIIIEDIKTILWNRQFWVLMAKEWVSFLGKHHRIYLVGGFNPSETISQLGLLFPIYGKITSVPNHQPVIQYAQEVTVVSSFVVWHLSAVRLTLIKCGSGKITRFTIIPQPSSTCKWCFCLLAGTNDLFESRHHKAGYVFRFRTVGVEIHTWVGPIMANLSHGSADAQNSARKGSFVGLTRQADMPLMDAPNYSRWPAATQYVPPFGLKTQLMAWVQPANATGTNVSNYKDLWFENWAPRVPPKSMRIKPPIFVCHSHSHRIYIYIISVLETCSHINKLSAILREQPVKIPF